MSIEKTKKLLIFLHKYSLLITKENPATLEEKWKPVVDKLTDEQLRTGCEYVKTHDCQFITPIRFNFVAHGLIDTEIAYEQARDKIYNHPAVYHAAVKANINKTTATQEQEFTNFRRAYNYECDKVLRGETIKTIPAVINSDCSNPTYKNWKSQSISHARQYKKTIDDKHFSHDGWSQEKCMAFLKEKLGSKNKLVKSLEKNVGYYEHQ